MILGPLYLLYAIVWGAYIFVEWREMARYPVVLRAFSFLPVAMFVYFAIGSWFKPFTPIYWLLVVAIVCFPCITLFRYHRRRVKASQ